MFLGLSPLRWSGIIVGLVLLALAFMRLRRHADNRGETVLAIVLGAGLVALGLLPGLANLPAEIFSLRDQRGGRLMTLLIISSVLLWLAVLWNRYKIASMARSHDHLVRGLAKRSLAAGDRERMAADRRPVWVLVPALNEAENLAELLPQVPEEIEGLAVRVLVINDGSTDDTATVARSHGAIVVDMPTNVGGGTGLRTGFDIALEYKAEYVVTMDGDGQHDPAQLDRLLRPLVMDESDLVIGSRILGEHERASVARALGVRVFNAVINALLGTTITDCASGYRAIHADALRRLLLMQAQYHTAEMIIDASKRGMRIGEAPITIRRRWRGESKKGGNLFYGAFFLRTILKTWLR